MELNIGTRGSKLALAQSRWVKQMVEHRHPDVRVNLVRIKTKGDRVLDAPLSRIGGKGLFVKEIEEALLEGRVDVAVHSMKDVPAELPEGLFLCAFPEREDPRDAVVSTGGLFFGDLPRGARVGTSSLRRTAQLLALRPDLRIVPLRGNVDTRLGKLEKGETHAVVLALAGLRRLGLEARITQILEPEQVLPAVGQGALGLEVRREDGATIELLSFLNHEPTEVAVRAERAFLKTLEGGCQVPLAALARCEGDRVFLRGMVAEPDGSRVILDEAEGRAKDAEKVGEALARTLLEAGAREVLGRIYGRAAQEKPS